MNRRKGEKFISVCFLLILAVYLATIFYINLSCNPLFYSTDMYSDMKYAIEAWSQKSVFPENWVFGNQLYVIATPTIAALLYGVFQNPCIAMGVASSLMGIFTLLSFDWMIKPIFKKINPILLADIVFLSIVLFCGGPIHGETGWQLFFTMCSYYSCYAITAFLALGCYIRSEHILKPDVLAVFVLSCVMSFATGIQSIRQTIIMTVPIVAVEFLSIVCNKICKRKISVKQFTVCLSLSFCNLAGFLLSKVIKVQQVAIFGEIKIIDFSDLIMSTMTSVDNVFQLFYNRGMVITYICLIIILMAFVITARYFKNLSAEMKKCIAFFTISIVLIFAIDSFTTMNVRKIYYFLLYPFIAVIFGSCYMNLSNNFAKKLWISVLSILFCVNLFINIYPVDFSVNNGYTNIAKYLIDSNVKTVYAQWNLGESIAIASDWEIEAGFWNSSDKPFEKVNYLCNPTVFNESPDKCVYVFKGWSAVEEAMRVAQDYNCELKMVKYFEGEDIYIYRSDEQMMLLSDNSGI